MTPQPRSGQLIDPVPSVPAEGGSIYPRSKRADYAIDPETGCWNWLKSKNPRGYPTNRQHRRYYELAYGVDITGLDVHHTCHNASCVNPAHLEPVARAKHLQGHKRAKSPLTIPQVIEIRSSRKTMAELAKDYGVPETTIWDIRRGKNWKGIGPDRPEVFCRECGAAIVDGRRSKEFCSTAHKANFGARKRRARKRTLADEL